MEWSMEDVFKKLILKIAKNMKKDEEDVKKKIKLLRSAYVSEKRKVESSKKSGSSAEHMYHPHLYYYDELNFLNSAVIFRKTTSNLIKQEESKTPTLFYESENCILEESYNFDDSTLNIEESQESLLASNSADTPRSSKSFSKSFKRKKSERDEKFNSAIEAFVRQADMSCTMMSNKQEDNMYLAFGKSISFQLAQLSLSSAAGAMSEIQLILSNKILKENKDDILQIALHDANIK